MRQTPPQLHHRTTNLIPQRHMALMVMQRRRSAAMSPEMHTASVMAVFNADAMVAACGGCVFDVGRAPAEARHECWARRGGGCVGGGGPVAVSVSVSVAHFDGW